MKYGCHAICYAIIIHIMKNSLTDMSKLLKTITAIQEYIICANCKQSYKKKWCKDTCWFCRQFLPIRDTYTSILQNIDWWYLKSGETSREEYYNQFLDNLSRWATYFSIVPTSRELQIINELRNIKDWSREYWH